MLFFKPSPHHQTDASVLPGNLFLYGLCVGLSEQVEERAAEVVGVAVGIAQLVRYRRQEQVPTCRQGAEINYCYGRINVEKCKWAKKCFEDTLKLSVLSMKFINELC